MLGRFGFKNKSGFSLSPVTVATSSETDGDVALPVGTVVGDLVIMCQHAYSTGTYPTDVSPSGWALLKAYSAVQGSYYLRTNWFAKIITQDDLNAGVVSCLHGNGASRQFLYLIRPSSGMLVSQLHVASSRTATAGPNTSPGNWEFTPVIHTWVALAACCNGPGNGPTDSTMTPVGTVYSASSMRVWAAFDNNAMPTITAVPSSANAYFNSISAIGVQIY